MPRCTQVSEWVQRILTAGDAFAGPEGGAALRALLGAQAAKFFRAYHAENLEGAHSMLEKELWRAIPPASVSGALLACARSRWVQEKSCVDRLGNANQHCSSDRHFWRAVSHATVQRGQAG